MVLEQYELMIDCGDGASSTAPTALPAVRDIVLTHNHLDHVSGLTATLNLKHRLSPESTTTLHFHEECLSRVEASLSMLGKRTLQSIQLRPFATSPLSGSERLADLQSIPVYCSTSVPSAKRALRILPTRHCKGSVGYLLTESRTRLKEKWARDKSSIASVMANRSSEEKKALRLEMEEEYDVILVAHLGDTPRLNEKEMSILASAPIEHLVLESTILNSADFEAKVHRAHSTLEDSIKTFRNLSVGNLILSHVSPKYSLNNIAHHLKRHFRQSPQDIDKVNVLFGANLHPASSLCPPLTHPIKDPPARLHSRLPRISKTHKKNKSYGK